MEQLSTTQDKLVLKPTKTQAQAILCPAFELLYGGKPGGGKSFSALIAVLDELIRSNDPEFSAVLFRRTFPQLTGRGSLIEQSREMFSSVGGEFNEAGKFWRFPGGQIVLFSHMANKNDHYDHQGKEYNIVAFDELAHFTEDQYLYLFSRIRKKSSGAARSRMICTSNPGSQWVLERWRPWLDPEHPKPAKAGELRWFRRDGDTEIECKQNDPGAWSRSFVPSSWVDNPHIDQAEYERNLDMLPFIERERLKHGNWKVQEGRGLILNREWFQRASTIPTGFQAYRYWDFAATAKKAASDDPDYTATCFLGFDGHNFYIRLDRKRVTWSTTKKWVEACLNAEKWVIHGGEEEGGASGKALSHELMEIGSKVGVAWRPTRPQGDKVTRALRWSAFAEQGRVYIIDQGEPIDAILGEFHAFPEGSHDDMVDAVSGAFDLWSQNYTAGTPVKGRYKA